MKNLKNESIENFSKKYNENKFFLENLFKYLIIKKEEEKKNNLNYFFKWNKENNEKKKDDSTIKKFLKKLKKDISYKKKINKLFFFLNTKNSIIENDTLKEKKKYLSIFSYLYWKRPIRKNGL